MSSSPLATCDACKPQQPSQAPLRQQQKPQSYTFTVTFRRGERVLVTVYGASFYYQANHIVSHGFRNCVYLVADGDQTKGQAAVFYSWYCTNSWHPTPRPLLSEIKPFHQERYEHQQDQMREERK